LCLGCWWTHSQVGWLGLWFGTESASDEISQWLCHDNSFINTVVSWSLSLLLLTIIIIKFYIAHVAWWLSGRALDLQLTGLNSQLVRFHVTLVNSALHPSGVANRAPALAGSKGGNGILTCAGWQVTLCVIPYGM